MTEVNNKLNPSLETGTETVQKHKEENNLSFLGIDEKYIHNNILTNAVVSKKLHEIVNENEKFSINIKGIEYNAIWKDGVYVFENKPTERVNIYGGEILGKYKSELIKAPLPKETPSKIVKAAEVELKDMKSELPPQDSESKMEVGSMKENIKKVVDTVEEQVEENKTSAPGLDTFFNSLLAGFKDSPMGQFFAGILSAITGFGAKMKGEITKQTATRNIEKDNEIQKKGTEKEISFSINTIKKEYITSDFHLQNVAEIRLDEIIAPNQKLAIQSKNGKKYNLEWKNGTYMYEGTSQRALIFDGDQLLAYNTKYKENYKEKKDDLEKYYAPVEHRSVGVLRGPKRGRKKGTTLCAKTTRLDLKNIAGINIERGDAQPLRVKYQKQGLLQKFPSYDSGNNYAELFLEATKQDIHDHRVACYKSKIDGMWYVLDPYYGKIPGRKKREDPVPWDAYKKYMESIGRPFYGAKYYA